MPSFIVPRQLAKVEYENVCPPPGREILCKDSVAIHLSEQERSAKRARIEQYAVNYLMGKPPQIRSATLRGPFTRNWVNPWKLGSQTTQEVPVSPRLTKKHRTINMETKILNGEGEDNRPVQKTTRPSGPSTDHGEAVKRLTPTFEAKPTQIVAVLADANGRWHCPVPNCPIASKGYKFERHLARHVASNHGDSMRINFTLASPHPTLSTRTRQFPRTDTSSPAANPDTTLPSPPDTNPEAAPRPQRNGVATAFQEGVHEYENFQTIQQHKNVIISGLEDREKLMRALRESGATITSLSTDTQGANG